MTPAFPAWNEKPEDGASSYPRPLAVSFSSLVKFVRPTSLRLRMHEEMKTWLLKA